jgi:LysM repeat protein
VWRSLVALVSSIVVVLAGVAAGSSPRAHLTIDTNTGSVTSVLVPSEATLECDGRARANGFLAKTATSACAAVRKGSVTAVAAEHRKARLCADVYGGPQRARITGTVGSRRVSVAIDRADGCGISEWNRLLALLGDPERRGPIPRRRPPSATTTTAAPATYLVGRGDTLTTIAKQFHTSVGAIVAANQLEDPDALVEGQRLVMPSPFAVRVDAALDTDGSVKLALVGAQPSELVTFVITLPDGSTYTGAPHRAGGDGTVATRYEAALKFGSYRVNASGTAGTTAEAAFHVRPPG